MGNQITVREISELDDGWLEIVLLGGYSDAAYVRGALNNQKGVTTTEPEQSPAARGVAMAFRARGNDVNPLSKNKAKRVLAEDPYIHVIPNA